MNKVKTKANRIAFTRERIAKLPAPTTGRAIYHDTKTPGLILRVTATGTKSFTWYRKVNGEPVKIALGTFPAISIDAARNLAKGHALEQANGRDPRETKRKSRQEVTMKDLLAHWKEYAKARKKSWREDERICKVHFEKWSNRKLSAIKRPEVQAMHLRLKDSAGPYMANRVHELLRAMFNRAKEDLGYDGENPCLGIKRFHEQKRDRFLHAGELKAFFAALEAEVNDVFRDFFWMSLLTGARQANVQEMRWNEIDFDAALWRIPETKAGIPVVVPLTVAAHGILSRRKADSESEWVFPGHRRGCHLAEPKFAWARIIKRAGLSDVRPHDLRRSLGSWMAMTGAGLPIVGKMLGHSQPTTTAIYARLSVDPVRAAAEAATSAMFLAGGITLDVRAKEGGDDE